MDKAYDSSSIEQNRYQHWESSGYFKPNPNATPAYSIILPPPNVTGSLHMGHGFEHTLMDVLIRYHRMCGQKVLWQPGTDHAGIATQLVVERQLEKQNLTRHDLGREAFIDRVWEWKLQSGGHITQQMRRLGTSPDWSKERFTLDQGLSDAVQKVFVELYDQGLIYRKKRLTNWDPVFKTAVSDLEVISKEKSGHMWHIRYPLAQGGHVEVATTRPETILGDAAIAVHPNDERYTHLIGQMACVPFCQREIPIVADEHVDPSFGTGCLKVTPAHDFNDHEIGKRHKLPLINILNDDATLNQDMPEAYRGLDRFEARDRIVKDLEQQQLLIKVEPHTLSVPCNDRGGAIIEPYLTDQWFVAIDSLAQPAIRAVEQGDIQFYPDNAKNLYYEWMNNITDWCISRQLWWGHRIPAWYDKDKNIYVGKSEASVRQKHQLPDDLKLHQDPDVLDTWFSSALFPFSSLGWPQQTDSLKSFYPTSVLVTGFDLIFFWVARMIMMGLKFMGDVPFKTVYFHGLIRDEQGHKMSKSKGNVIDPVDLIDGIAQGSLIEKRTANLMQPKLKANIEKQTRQQFPQGIESHGTDALRLTFCALASSSRDINFDMSRLKGYRNFCNKLWNAARYVLGKINEPPLLVEDFSTLSATDQWVLAQLDQTIEQAHGAMIQYRFDHLSKVLYEFVWNIFCDWYLEICKITLEDSKTSSQTQWVLVHVLDQILRLMHPIIPFITDHIWQEIKPLINSSHPSIMLSEYPTTSGFKWPEHQPIDEVCALIGHVRTLRAKMDLPPSLQIELFVHQATDEQQQVFNRQQALIQRLAKVKQLHFVKQVEQQGTVSVLMEQMTLFLKLEGLIDVDKEKARLEKEQDKWQQQLDRSEHKLSNPKFVDKAPAHVVDQEKSKIQLANESLTKIKSELNRLVKT